MQRLFRIDFYPQDWLVKTQGLTPEQCGFYIQIISLIYASRGAIENDPFRISRLLMTSVRKTRSIVNELLSLGKLELNDGLISNKRAINELKIKNEHFESSSKGGRKTAEKRPKTIDNNDIDCSDGTCSLSTSSLSPSLSPTPLEKEELASSEKIETTKKEEIPKSWLQFGVDCGKSNQVVLSSWERFKDYMTEKNVFPFPRNRWEGWIKKERTET